MEVDEQKDSGLEILDPVSLGAEDNGQDEELLWQRRREENDREQAVSDLLCIACQTNSKDKTQNPDSLLCEECRERYSKLRVPVWVMGFLAAIAAVLVFSSLQLPPVISTYKTYLAAENQRKNAEYIYSMYDYLTVLEEYGDSLPVIIKAVDVAMKAQYFDAAAYILNTYLVGKEVSDGQYKKVMEISDLLDKYYETTEYCGSLLQVAEDPDELRPELLALLDEEDTDKTYVYFLLASISPDYDQAVYYYQLACEQDERFTYPLSYYGNALRRGGNMQAAMDVYTEAISKNACDASSIRGIGILELLEGKSEQGMQTIAKAYEMNPYELYMPDAMVIALCESGRRDEALALLEEKESEGYGFDESMYEYLDKQITLEQYYIQ